MYVKKIHLFPFKSLKGIDLDEWEVDEHGLKYDRVFMLAHKRQSGEWMPVTQREEPSLARIVQKVNESDLELSYPGGPSLTLPLQHTHLAGIGPNIDLLLWGEAMSCKNISNDEMKDFFVQFFNRESYNADNVAIVAPDSRRIIPRQQEHTSEFMKKADNITSSFQDIWPCSLMTTASFEDLENHTRYMNEDIKININSFRMNFTIETDEPWVEDDWIRVAINGHEFGVDTPAERCPVPSVDQDLGEFRKSRFPLPALNRFRVLEKGKTPCFGVNMVNKDSGYKIRVGDKVQILEQQAF